MKKLINAFAVFGVLLAACNEPEKKDATSAEKNVSAIDSSSSAAMSKMAGSNTTGYFMSAADMRTYISNLADTDQIGFTVDYERNGWIFVKNDDAAQKDEDDIRQLIGGPCKCSPCCGSPPDSSSTY